MSATAVMAVTGVRNSWETSATNLRDMASSARSSATLSSRAAAASLNLAVSSASSSWPCTGRRVSSLPSPSAWAAALSRLTGSSTRRADSRATTRAISTTAVPPWVSRVLSMDSWLSSARSGKKTNARSPVASASRPLWR